MAGLAYLPLGCNLVLTVQPGPILEYAARTNQDANGLLTQAGVPVGVLLFLDKVGESLAHIDHVLAGTVVGDTEQELRVAIVLVLHGPLVDEEKFLEALSARRSPTGNGRYNATLDLDQRDGEATRLTRCIITSARWDFVAQQQPRGDPHCS